MNKFVDPNPQGTDTLKAALVVGLPLILVPALSLLWLAVSGRF